MTEQTTNPPAPTCGFTSKTDFRVYYEDTDAGGVVYYANYLRFAERGRTEYLRQIGMDHIQLMREHGLLFVVKTFNAIYHASAKLDDLLTVETQITALGGASMDMTQTLRHQDGRVLVTASTKLVAITATGQVLRIPSPLREEFQSRLSPQKEGV